MYYNAHDHAPHSHRAHHAHCDLLFHDHANSLKEAFQDSSKNSFLEILLSSSLSYKDLN